MGAFISGLASLELNCVGLFLIALPVAIPGYARAFDAAPVPTALVHGWDDELCPVDDAIAFARARGDAITLVRDDHRLSAHVDFVAEQFRQFLDNYVVSTRDFFASCPKGLEYLLVDELKALGAQRCARGARRRAFQRRTGRRLSRLPVVAPGQPRADAARASLPPRTAMRCTPVRSRSTGQRHLDVDASFAVDAVGSTSGITNTQFAALRVKDAIVDQFREKSGKRPNVDTDRPALRVNLVLRRGQAIVEHRPVRHAAASARLPARQGHRAAEGKSCRGDAAARRLAGGVRGRRRHRRSAVRLRHPADRGGADGGRCRAGLRRDYFGFLGWRGHDAALWKTLHDDAQTRATAGLQALQPVFFGFDQDPTVLNEAKHNAQFARTVRLHPLRSAIAGASASAARTRSAGTGDLQSAVRRAHGCR